MGSSQPGSQLERIRAGPVGAVRTGLAGERGCGQWTGRPHPQLVFIGEQIWGGAGWEEGLQKVRRWAPLSIGVGGEIRGGTSQREGPQVVDWLALPPIGMGGDQGQDQPLGGSSGQFGWWGPIRGEPTGGKGCRLIGVGQANGQGWPRGRVTGGLAGTLPSLGVGEDDKGWVWPGGGATGGWPASPTP